MSGCASATVQTYATDIQFSTKLTFFTQSTDCDSRLLSAHYEIRMMLCHFDVLTLVVSMLWIFLTQSGEVERTKMNICCRVALSCFVWLVLRRPLQLAILVYCFIITIAIKVIKMGHCILLSKLVALLVMAIGSMRWVLSSDYLTSHVPFDNWQ